MGARVVGEDWRDFLPSIGLLALGAALLYVGHALHPA